MQIQRNYGCLLQESSPLPADWKSINKDNHEKIERTFNCGDYKGSREFAIGVAMVANEKNHHPEIHLCGDKVTVTTWTPNLNKVTNKDWELAEALNKLQVQSGTTGFDTVAIPTSSEDWLHRPGEGLVKTYQLKDFNEAMAFFVKVCALAKHLRYEIHLNWDTVTVTIHTFNPVHWMLAKNIDKIK